MWSRARGPASSRTPDNLVELLELRASSNPGDGYAFLLGSEVEGPRAELSFSTLYRRAREVAAQLDRAGARGERVVLVFAPGLEFIVGLFACLMAGAIAVPVYPPNPSRLYKTLPLLEAIASNAEARFALTSADLIEMASAVAELSEGLAQLEWHSIADGGDAEGWTPPAIDPSQLAFLQYTSGSTGEPKGVMLSHANLLCNEAMIAAGFDHSADTRVVGWLPLYHDMGLIGNVLNPLFVGGSALLLSPISFIKRPMIWLEAVSSFRATTSGGPNFAYDLCVDRLEPELLPHLDLSCWRVAFNGAEPIRAATLQRFAETFAPAGFDRNALFPCYGLAESTLAVTVTDIDHFPRVLQARRSALEAGRYQPARGAFAGDRVSLVSSGRPVLDGELAIIDPETGVELGEGRVGEICVRGQHVAGGYWGRPEQSKATFAFELGSTGGAHELEAGEAEDADDPDEGQGEGRGGWLRSGDLGFITDDELFVCGRRKDLLIVRGRNLHPHDLEQAIADASPAIRKGCVVAFATELDELEEIVVVAEIRDATSPDVLDAIVDLIREVLSDGFGVRPLEVVLVGARSLPKTSSGKLRRSATRDAWRGARLERLVHSDRKQQPKVEVEPPRDVVEARVLEICADVLEQPGLTREDDFFKLGADSVAIASMTAKLEQVLGREIQLGAVFDAPSVAGLSDWLRQDGYDTTRLRARELPLTVDMQRLLQVAQNSDAPGDCLHIAAAFTLRGEGLEGEALRERLELALTSFTSRHAALRTCFARDEEGALKQQIHAGGGPRLRRQTLGGLEELEGSYAEVVKRPFVLHRAPLWRFELLELAGAEPTLCVVAHHLVADHASFRVLIAELEAELSGDARALGSPDDAALVLLAKTEPKVDVHAAESFEGIEPLSFAALTGRPPDASYAAGSVFVELDPATNRGIDALARSLGVLPAALGFAVLQLLLHRVCGVERFAVGVPVDQRIALGTPEAVGYFGVPVPVSCEVHPSDTPRVLARRTQGQLRRIMDAPGMPATLGATLERALGRCPGVPLLQVLFNVLPAPEHGRSPRGPKLQRLPFGPVSLDVDLSLALSRNHNGGAIELHHRLDVLDRAAARQFVEAYVELLSELARDIDTPLSHHQWPDSCPAAPPRRRVALASTFTADPMFATVVGWGRLFDVPFEVEPASYGQVIQPLLDPASALRSEDVVARVLLVRLIDVFRERREVPTLDDYQDWCADLLDGVREAASAGLTIIGIPPSEVAGELLELERELAEGLAAIAGVQVLGPERMLAGLEIDDAIFDPQAEDLAHMPFTAPAYAAMATAVVRELWRHDRQPLKLVAVDADNSLWAGVVGEDGPQGLDPKPFAPLHRRLRQCRSAGVLLAVISNNDPDMVREALQHPDLPNVEEFIAIEGGYHAKAERLIGLAERLDLGVESFCFLDDNEVEVAAMRDACPEALVFQLPEPSEIEGFIRRLWALDVGRRTEADRERPRRYAEELARRSSRKPGQGHIEFVRSLELRVTPRPLQRHLERAAQLSARTNQFNLRKRPRTADDIATLIDEPDTFGAVFEVHDRFGDYGVVGLVLARAEQQELVVDTLLLSCRVLGRGVELQLMRWLAEEAEERGLASVRLQAEASPRNTPARRFVRRVGDATGGELVETGAGALELRVKTSGLRLIGLQALLERVEAVTSSSNSRRLDLDRRLEGRRLSWVATKLRTGEDVLRAFGIHWLRPGITPRQVESVGELTVEIVARMAALLQLSSFDIEASFLEAGANSLTAVELLADLRRDLGLELTLDDLIAAPSARALAAVAVGVRETGEPRREMSLPERLALDAQLDPRLAPEPSRVELEEFRRVLLTGVTGFVGSHLLFELLRQSDATVVCLIRARDVEHGWERLRAALERSELTWSKALRRRVEILPGDLSATRLGLGGDAWRREAAELDAIYHCGASVNFSAPYELQRATNVEGTRSLIELACAERATPLHYVSTMGVLIGPSCLEHEYLEEDAIPGAPAQLPLGYQQSKWVAERLVLEAGARGLPISVYRPGTIGPHTTTGCHNHSDLFMLLLRAATRVRSLPDVRAVDAAPVDWVVAMIATLSRRHEARGRTVHLVHPEPVEIATMLEWYKLAGNGMRLREFDGWLETVRMELGDDPEHPLSSLRPILDSEAGLEFCRLFNLAPKMRCTRALELAELIELPCPPLDLAQMQRWHARLREDGLIDDLRDDFGRARRYMWFRERMLGGMTLKEGGRTPLELDLVASVASLRQMLDERRIDLAGAVRCPALHPAPLHVREGQWTVRPHRGLGRLSSAEASLISIRMELVDEDGRELWIEGEKIARARFDVMRQVRTFELRLGDRSGTLATGTARVPGETWLEDQVYNVEFDPEVPEGERRRARLLYLAWLGGNLGRTFYDLALRLGASVITGK